MRAWTFTARGPITKVLRLSTLPDPSPSSLQPNEVLVRVSHVGLEHALSALVAVFPHPTSTPWIPELSFAGTVTAVGSASSKSTSFPVFRPGDPVFGGLNIKSFLFGRGGTLAESIVVPTSSLAHRPPSLPPDQAGACLATNGSTAVLIAEAVHLKRGDRVLITAAASGLGRLLTQIARAIVGPDGSVVGTCSAASAASIRSLGADETIDYARHPSTSTYLIQHHQEPKFDAIIDIAGTDPHLWPRSPAYLRRHGTLLFAGNLPLTHSSSPAHTFTLFGTLRWLLHIRLESFRPVWLGGIPERTPTFLSGRVSPETLRKVVGFVERGELSGVVVERVYEMEDAVEGYERLMRGGGGMGKVVVHVQD